MPCPKTDYILQEYFADSLAPLASEEIERHLSQCADCSQELELLLQTKTTLESWRAESTPHWDRGLELFRREHQATGESRSWFTLWQWGPSAASFAMLCILLLNTNLTGSESGFSLSFGGETDDREELQVIIADFERRQRTELNALVARFEERQDANNLQLMQAVMAQTQQTTADNFDRIFAYFEEQRLQDRELLSQSYQQLADSDYATIQSLQDLAQFVSFQGGLQ